MKDSLRVQVGDVRRTATSLVITSVLAFGLAITAAIPAYAIAWNERATNQGYSQAFGYTGGGSCGGVTATSSTSTSISVYAGGWCEDRRVRWYGFQPSTGTVGFTNYKYGGSGGGSTSQSHGGYANTGYGALKY